jgi:membrane associated rhomboid family serine protease
MEPAHSASPVPTPASVVAETKPATAYVTAALILINLLVFIFVQKTDVTSAVTRAHAVLPYSVITGYRLVGREDGSLQAITGHENINRATTVSATGGEALFNIKTALPMSTLLTAMFLHAGRLHPLNAFLFGNGTDS